MDILIRKKYAQERERKNEKKLLCIVVAVIVIVLAIFTAEYCKSQKILRELESLENGYQEFGTVAWIMQDKLEIGEEGK